MLRVRFRKKARKCYYWWKLSKECRNCSVLFLTTACKSVIIQNLKGGKEGRERGRKEGNQQSNWAGLMCFIKYTDSRSNGNRQKNIFLRMRSNMLRLAF